MSKDKKSVVLLSGGPDSSTVAYWAKSNGYSLHALVLDLGQPSAKMELRSAKYVAHELRMPLKVVTVSYTHLTLPTTERV